MDRLRSGLWVLALFAGAACQSTPSASPSGEMAGTPGNGTSGIEETTTETVLSLEGNGGQHMGDPKETSISGPGGGGGVPGDSVNASISGASGSHALVEAGGNDTDPQSREALEAGGNGPTTPTDPEPDGTGPADSGSVSPETTAESPGGDPVACEDRKADDTAGVLVDGNAGTDSDGCGRASEPCQSIRAGIRQALGRSRQHDGDQVTVYVASGEYEETITLTAGVRIEGGWQAIGANWFPLCDPEASDAVTVRAPATSNTTIMADALGGTATLATLTVLSKLEANRGESLYGIFARGPDTDLTLDDVRVVVSGGGMGDSGATGEPGPSGGLGGCAAGTGVPGTPRSDLGPGARQGTFGADGYQPSDGEQGALGEDLGGSNNGMDPSDTGRCVSGCGTCGASHTCSSAPDSCGSKGTAGCGGGPGNGGKGGRGGGSSVALYAWGATVTVVGGWLETGPGGRGGPGGQGGPGGAGAPGSPGAQATSVCTQCTATRILLVVRSCSESNAGVGAGGTPGTPGAVGSAGGRGGGGSGGFSYAIFLSTDSAVEYSGTTLVHGSEGLPDTNGAPGRAGQVGGPDGPQSAPSV